jgi:hypothetical protein
LFGPASAGFMNPAETAFVGVCSWESRRSPKPLHKVRLLALLFFAGVARLRKAAVP